MKFFASPDFKPVSKQMFHIAIPIAISGLVLQVQTLIDTAFLARYSTTLPDGVHLSGSEILSVVGNVFFPYLVALSFIWSISTGVVILVSQRLGANEPGSARRFAVTAIKYNTLLSWLVYLFWFFFARQVFMLMGVHQPILTVSLDYMRFLSLELLYLGLSTSIGAVFQGAGNTRPEMITGIMRSILHIVLDYLFIFGNFGLPEMGVVGAGMASSLSGLLACLVLLLVLLTSQKLPFRVNLKSVCLARLCD